MLDMEYTKTEFYAAWIASNGRSSFKRPHPLYVGDWQRWDGEEPKEGWHKGGNLSATLAEGFHHHENYGSFEYVSKDRAKVQLVIDASQAVFKGLCLAWGVKDA